MASILERLNKMREDARGSESAAPASTQDDILRRLDEMRRDARGTGVPQRTDNHSVLHQIEQETGRNATAERLAPVQKPQTILGAIRELPKLIGEGIQAKAKVEADMATDDIIDPLEAAGLGLAKGMGALSAGEAIGAGIGKITGNEDIQKRAREVSDINDQMLKEAKEQNSLAFGAGNIGGNLMLMSGIGQGLGTIKGLGQLPTIARGAIKGLGTLAGAEAIHGAGAAATGKITPGEYAKNVAVSGIAGAAGGALSAGVNAAGLKLLRGMNKAKDGVITAGSDFIGAQNKELPNVLLGGASSLGYSAGVTGTQELSKAITDEDYTPDWNQIGTSALTAFAFGAINAYLRTAQTSEANRSTMQQVNDAVQDSYRKWSEATDPVIKAQYAEETAAWADRAIKSLADMQIVGADQQVRDMADFLWNIEQEMAAYTTLNTNFGAELGTGGALVPGMAGGLAPTGGQPAPETPRGAPPDQTGALAALAVNGNVPAEAPKAQPEGLELPAPAGTTPAPPDQTGALAAPAANGSVPTAQNAPAQRPESTPVELPTLEGDKNAASMPETAGKITTPAAGTPGQPAERFSFRDVPIPTYEELIQKPDVPVVDIRRSQTVSFPQEREAFLESDAAKQMYSAPVVNRDTGEGIFITPATIKHTFSNLGWEQIELAEHLPEIIENAVLTHAEPSRKAPRDMTTGVYTLFGAAQTSEGVQPVKLTVKEYNIMGQDIPQNIKDYLGSGIQPETYASVYDGKVLVLEGIEKEGSSSSAGSAELSAGLYPSEPSSEGPSGFIAPATAETTADVRPSGPSEISVKDLLALVKGTRQETPEATPAQNVPAGTIQNQNGGITNAEQGIAGAVPAGAADGAAPAEPVSLYGRDAGRRGHELRRERAGRVPPEVRAAGNEKQQRELAGQRQQAVIDEPTQSPEALGVPYGSTSETLKRMPEWSWDDEIRGGVEWAASKGVEIVPVVGLLQVERDGKAAIMSGVIDRQAKVAYVRADSLQDSFSETVEHEVGHAITDPARVKAFKEQVQSRYKPEAWQTVYDAYRRKYAELTDDYAGMTDEEADLYVWEEILEDAYAGKNRYGVKAGLYGPEADAALGETPSENPTPTETRPEGGGAEPAANGIRGPPDRYSYAGRNAHGANSETLEAAERLEMQGVDAEDIRQETGWFRGSDGLWRYEIDDSGMEYYRGGDAYFRTAHPQYAEYQELMERMLGGELLPEADETRLQELDELWGHEYGRLSERVDRGNATLADLIQHDELFRAYPQLRFTRVEFADLPGGTRGEYDAERNAIRLAERLRNAPEDTLIHEIQHAIQKAEGFAKGSSTEYWAEKLTEERKTWLKEADARVRDAFDAMPEEAKNKVREMNRANIGQDYDTAARIEEELYASGYGDMLAAYQDAVFDRANEQQRQADHDVRDEAYGLYRNTAGEIEARDAASRRSMTPEQRRATRPNTGNNATVFADDEESGWNTADEYDPETASIKQQIENSRDILNGMDIVASATVPENLENKDTAAKWAAERLKPTGYQVDRQGYGVITFTKKDMDRGLRYADTPAEKAALAVLPQVLKRGIEIGGHEQHKDRPKQTITFAAPVSLNGTRGNMAVVVNKNGNHYYAHRIVLPDGSSFVFSDETKNDAAQELSRGVAVSGSHADTTSATSKQRIAQGDAEVKGLEQPEIEGEVRAAAAEAAKQDYRAQFGPDMAAKQPKQRAERSVQRRTAPQHDPIPDPPYPEGYNSIEEFIASSTARAEAAKAERLRNVSKDDFVGTPALQKIGVKIDNSVGIYSRLRWLIDNDRAAKQIQRETHRAERRLGATDAERNFASGIAAGVYNASDIPASMNRDKVMELADYYWAEQAVADDRIRKQREQIGRALEEKMEDLFKDSDEFKPSKAIVLNYRTPQRNMLHIFGDERGKAINETLFDPVAVNEAERFRFVNRMHDEVRTFAGEDGKQRKLTKEERALVQMLIEGKAVAEEVASMEMHGAIENVAHNIRNGGDAGDSAKEFGLSREEEKLAVKYARWLQTDEALHSGKVDAVKVENAAKKYSELFDQFYDAINDFLVAHGYEPIGFIKGYAPHIQPENNQNLLNKALNTLGINTDVTRLPSSIAGLTANYKPNKRWNPYFLSRTSDVTDYDIASAFESYVDYMSDVLYHTDDIMRVRQAAKYFRQTYAPEEIKNNLSWANELRYGTTEQKANYLRDQGAIDRSTVLSPADINAQMDEYVEKLFGDITKTTKYSDLVMWLDNYANILAGKQSAADRAPESMWGREVLNIGNKLVRTFAQANVAGNLSSMLNQTAQIPMIQAELGSRWTAAAIADIMSGKLRRGEWAGQSDFLTGKKGIEYLVSTPGEMVLTALFKPAEIMDTFVSTVAVRGKYLKELHAGKSPKEAMKAADAFGTAVMGSRMKGSKPLAFNSKNPIYQMVNVFQIEAFNSWEHIKEDLPRDFRTIEKEQGKGKAALALAGVIVKALLLTFLMNRLAEKTYGGTPAPFDLLGMTANFIASGNGLTTNAYLETLIDNAWEKISGERLFGTEDHIGEEPFDYETALKDLGYNVSNDIPFLRNAAGLLGLGDQTLPMPDIYGGIKGTVDSIKSNGVASWDTGRAALKLLSQLIPGGRQIQKTALGLETVLRGGDFSGTGEKEKLKYPTEDDFWSTVQSIMFGKHATEASDEYYASGASALSANQTRLWRSLTEGGADPGETYDAIQSYRKIANDDDLTSYEKGVQERALIRDLDMTDDQKLEMYRELSNADSRAEKFRTIMDTGLSFAQTISAYDKYAEIDADEGKKATKKATAFSKWIDQQGYKSSQAKAIKEELKFWNIIPADATRYEKLTDAGLETEDAFKLTNALADLKPEPGKENVSDMQKYRVIDSSNLSDREKIAAVGTIMGTDMTTESGNPSQYAKMLELLDGGVTLDQYLDLSEADAVDGYLRYQTVSAGRGYGITPAAYIKFRQIMPSYDADGNGSYTQKEVQAALDSMSGAGGLTLPSLGGEQNVTLTNTQKAVLWQMANKSWKGYNNPFDATVGQWVYDALHAEPEENSLPILRGEAGDLPKLNLQGSKE